MTIIRYGKNGQVTFFSEEERQEALDYLENSSNVVFRDEQNQTAGAWGPEKRIRFLSPEGVPASLVRNWTAGRRINCAELYDEVMRIRGGH